MHVSINVCTRGLALYKADGCLRSRPVRVTLLLVSKEGNSCWTSLIIFYQVIWTSRERRRGRPTRGLLKTHMVWSMRIFSVSNLLYELPLVRNLLLCHIIFIDLFYSLFICHLHWCTSIITPMYNVQRCTFVININKLKKDIYILGTQKSSCRFLLIIILTDN